MSVNQNDLGALQELDAKGKLSAEQLERVARNPKHPIHKRLNWDDKLAAYKYRLEQCRSIIRSYRVVITVAKRTLSVPVYIHDVQRRSGYVRTANLEDRSRAEQEEALHYEFVRALGMLERAVSIAEFAGSPIATAATKLLRQLERLTESLAPPQEESEVA